ncbi:MAG: helix-turn-helix transcriptional regulator [Clostridia bacterium]|nr:helix-turn-helix transcriptional regulator [Clostridia bacterium]
MNSRTVHPNMEDQTELERDIYVVSSGYYNLKTTPVSCSRPNGRSDFFLYYVLKGQSRYVMNGQNYTADSGDVVFYNYNDIQYYVHDVPSQVYWVHFNGSIAAKLLSDLQFNSSMKIHTAANLSMYFENILNEISVKRKHYFKMASGNLVALLTAISRGIGSVQTNTDLDYIISLMNDTENSSMSLSDYSAICHLSKWQFIRKFKDYTGTTPVQFKNNIILNSAKWYLLNTNCTVKEISDILNFENVYYFSNMFKKNTGQSPTQYRKNPD